MVLYVLALSVEASLPVGFYEKLLKVVERCSGDGVVLMGIHPVARKLLLEDDC